MFCISSNFYQIVKHLKCKIVAKVNKQVRSIFLVCCLPIKYCSQQQSARNTYLETLTTASQMSHIYLHFVLNLNSI